jgi:hypothetical protein
MIVVGVIWDWVPLLVCTTSIASHDLRDQVCRCRTSTTCLCLLIKQCQNGTMIKFDDVSFVCVLDLEAFLLIRCIWGNLSLETHTKSPIARPVLAMVHGSSRWEMGEPSRSSWANGRAIWGRPDLVILFELCSLWGSLCYRSYSVDICRWFLLEDEFASVELENMGCHHLSHHFKWRLLVQKLFAASEPFSTE